MNYERLQQIENEISKRNKEDKLKNYNKASDGRRTVHKKQVAFHKCKKRCRFVFGGNRSGKTECGAAETVYLARGIHPYRENRKRSQREHFQCEHSQCEDVFGWVVSVSQQVQRDVAQKKILAYLHPSYIADITMLSGKKDNPQSGVIDQIFVKNAFGGISVIGFKSCDQSREKFQGASLDFVWFDEEPPKDIYDECRMRLLDKCGELFCTMTPLKGLTYIYDEIYLNSLNNPEVWHIFMEWADNPFLNKKEVALLESSMPGDMLESRKYGRFYKAQGLVYSEFEENFHVIQPFDIDPSWQDNISIDPGLNNPLSCHFYAVDFDGNIYVAAEHYEAGKDIDYHANRISALADKIGWKRDNKGRLNALIDSAANQKTLSGSRSVAELFCERGIMVNTNVNKDIFGGIARVKSYLLKDGIAPKLFIFKNCVNLIREMKSYWWGDGDTPKKCDDHALDELRYYIMTRPKNMFKTVQNEIQKDKERLYRKIRRSKKFGAALPLII